MYAIQINPLISSHTAVSKDDLKKLTKSNNQIKNWQTISDVTPLQMADYIGKGYALRGGVRVKGNKADHVESIQWLFLDFDHSTLQKSLQVSVSQFACLYYFTYSYIPGENEKHRLLFKLDRAITATEYSSLITYLLSTFYTEADIIESPGSLFFGAKCPEYVHILDENATFPVDNFLNVIGSVSTKGGMEGVTPPISGNASNFTGNSKAALPSDKADEELVKPRLEALRHIAKHIWLDKCNSEDIEELYCLDKHNFEKQPKGQNLSKWHGHRPDDTEKANGTGFLVIWNDEQLPPTWQNQATSEKGNFIDYWYKYSGKEFGDIDWDSDRGYKNYQTVVDDICNYFKVRLFDFAPVIKARDEQKNKKVFKGVAEIADEYCFEMRNGGMESFLIYDLDTHVWRTKSKILHVWRHCVMPAMIEAGISIDSMSDKQISNIKFVLSDKIRYRVTDKEKFDDMKNADYIPLANGEYNIISKEFEQAFKPEIYNQYRYPYLYHEERKESEKLALIWEWLEWTYKDEKTRQFIIDWLALNVMGVANHTNLMVCIWGTPGTGKSVVLKFIKNMMASLACTLDGRKLKDDGNRFLFQNVDGKYAVTIDEFNTDQNGWNSIKLLTGGIDPVIEVEQKGLQSYTTKFKGAITAGIQDKFVVPNSDDGGIRRRVVPIHHPASLKNEKYADIEKICVNPEYFKPLFFWLIENIKVDEAIARCKAYAASSSVQDGFRDILIAQDDVLGFMFEVCEFTDNPDDVVTNMQLQIAFETYLQHEKLQHITDRDRGRINKISQYIREKARIPGNGIKWTLCPEPGKDNRISINGKQARGFRGIKLKAVDTDSPI
jgi:hypothetical protein